MNSFQQTQGTSGLAGLLGGLFGDSGAPYQQAMNQYQQFGDKAQSAQNPFLQAGNNAIPQFQDWLTKMKDPSQFVNNIMGQYQQSPFAKYQQEQSIRAAQNAGSASGLTGSTPMMQQVQQNAQNISGEDMNKFLQNVLGVNTQFGAGNQMMVNQGANAANSLTNMYGNLGNQMGEAAYGKQAGQDQDFWNMIGGGLQLAGSFI